MADQDLRFAELEIEGHEKFTYPLSHVSRHCVQPGRRIDSAAHHRHWYRPPTRTHFVPGEMND